MKERIIGAVILVLVMVLVVPVFLDGPPDEAEIVSERVPLPGQSDQESRTVILERDRETPVPVTSQEPVPGTPVETRPEVAEERSAPEPVPPPAVEDEDTPGKTAAAASEPASSPAAPPAASPAGSSTGMWAVQLGSFGSKDNAERLAADLRQQGFAAFLSQLATDEEQLHRVRVGPQKDRESAEAMAARLAAAGHEGQVVPHP